MSGTITEWVFFLAGMGLGALLLFVSTVVAATCQDEEGV